MLKLKEEESIVDVKTMTNDELNLYLCLFFPLVDITSPDQFSINQNAVNELHVIQALLGSKPADIQFREYEPYVSVSNNITGIPIADYIKEKAGKQCKQIYDYMVEWKTDLKNMLAMILQERLPKTEAQELINTVVIDQNVMRLFCEALE